MLEQAVLIIHVITAIIIIGLILIQQGKGADAGASFGGGASQTMFGVQGSGNMLTRWTAVLATLFFITSLSLAYFAKQQSGSSASIFAEETPQVQEVDMQNSEIPVLEESSGAAQESSEDIPQ